MTTQRPAPDTLGQAWGETLGLTLGTLKFKLTTRKGKWVSRGIMFPAVFILGSPSVVGLSLISFILWRIVRNVVKVKAHMARRRAEKAAQGPKKRNVKRIRFEIKIG